MAGDPVIVRLQAKLKEYQTLIDETDQLSAQELKAILDDLDMNWPYLGHEVTVSGWATFLNETTELPERMWFDSATMVSYGFAIDEDDISLDDDVLATTHKIVYSLEYLDQSVNRKYTGKAHIDDVTLEFPFDSLEAKRNRLEYYHGEAIDTIDGIVLNSSNEEEAIARLASIKIRLESEPGMLHDMGHYLDSLLEYDTDASYCLRIDDIFYIMNDEEELIPCRPEGNVVLLATITSTAFINGVDEDDAEAYVPAVNARFIPPDATEAPRHIVVPMKSIDTIRSVRRQIYSEDD